MKTKIIALLFAFCAFSFKPILKVCAGIAIAKSITLEVRAQNPLYLNSTLNPSTVTWDVSFLYAPTYWVVRMKDSTDFNINVSNIYLKKQPGQSIGTPSNILWVNPSDGLIKVSPTTSLSLSSSQVTTALGFVPATTSYTVPSTFTVTRAINGTTFQPSSTKTAWVYYTIRINCTATIGGASSGTVSLQYSTNGGGTWIDVSQVENSNTVTLAIVLNSSTTQTGLVCGVIPIGAIVRINQSSSGTTTITYVRGQETY